MAIRTKQTIIANPCSTRHPPFGRGVRTVWYWLSRAMALAIAPLVLGSCAELGDLRTDTAHLRSDLHTNTETLTETLSQLAARLDELERRQVATDNTMRQTQQELTQAVEVLLKEALVTKNRLTSITSEPKQSKAAEKSERLARQPPAETQSAAPHGENALQGRNHLSLGMTEEDVRRTLGDPISVENTGGYIFWQYSQTNNQKYIVFDGGTRQVWGWRGW